MNISYMFNPSHNKDWKLISKHKDDFYIFSFLSVYLL